jgi:hypothetical protein
MTPIFTSSELAPTVADVEAPPPAPPKLVAPDRRGIDPRRWELVIPPSLAAELGDAPVLTAHRDVYARWEAATKRVGDLRRRHAEALEHDRATEAEFASGAKRKLAEPTAPPLELELTGATRAVDVLERELVAAGKRLFAASLEHVPAAQAALEARLDERDERVEELLGQAIALLDERALSAAEGGWLHRAQWETSVAPYLPRASTTRIGAELRELVQMLEFERAEARRKRFEAKVEEEMLFEAPRVPRPPSTRPMEERRAEAEARVRARLEREAAS